ncbi:MAG: hypothetical protein IPK62_04355 [Bacteroidetes bacterium]|nr:hypothetical protein [Bacteroidota bacterium]MBK8144275.1 hypothetical protein [Bacteroidota bacterium]MBP6314265.1 hypothetical protein [Chitinophagaceae bacterium]
MAINKNHEFEELDGIKCSIVEKLVKPERVDFLKKLLEYNRFTVVVVPSPAPKAAAKPAANTEASEAEPIVVAPVAETFTVGVSDYTFNVTNAIYGRSLKTPDGHVVTAAFWQQKEAISNDQVPYYEFKQQA